MHALRYMLNHFQFGVKGFTLPIGKVHDQSFINDIMFFLDGHANNLEKVKSTFDVFCKTYGAKINGPSLLEFGHLRSFMTLIGLWGWNEMDHKWKKHLVFGCACRIQGSQGSQLWYKFLHIVKAKFIT